MSDVDTTPTHVRAQEGAFDVDDAAEGKSVLQERYGDEYTANMEIAQSHFRRLPEAERQRLLRTREADGRLLINSPSEVARLVAEATRPPRELAAAVAQNGGDELATLRKMMGDKRSLYWRDPRVQARYRELIRQEKN